jgi:signal transduction histidine kinase
VERENTLVRTRIIRLAVWVSVLAIVLFGGPLGVAVFQYFEQAERDELERVTGSIAITVAGDVANDQTIQHVERPGDVEVRVYDETGTQLGGTLLAGGQAEASDMASGADAPGTAELQQALAGRVGDGTDGDNLVVGVPVTHSADVVGAVVSTAPRSVVLPTVLGVWCAMAALAVIAVGAAWLVGRGQSRRLAGPLEDLAVAARRLGEGDFSVRARIGGIPEIDAVSAALNFTAARLDGLLARERAFSADASHQLRTPLAGLRLRLEAALEQPGPELRRTVAASLVDADRLNSTIEELLTLARDDHDAPAGALDLAALLTELSPGWSGRLGVEGRELHVRIEPGLPGPLASAAAVRQVLAVLVDNATTHGAGTVTVTMREAPGAVAIDVSDEGLGVPGVEHVLVAGRADQGNGHGIGLALARRLAESQQGRLELTRSLPPVFTLLLPYSTSDAPPRSAGAPSPRP